MHGRTGRLCSLSTLAVIHLHLDGTPTPFTVRLHYRIRSLRFQSPHSLYVLLAKCLVYKMAVATGDREWKVKVAELAWEPIAPPLPNRGPMGAAAAAAVEFLEA